MATLHEWIEANGGEFSNNKIVQGAAALHSTPPWSGEVSSSPSQSMM